jgi:hypothetical protein
LAAKGIVACASLTFREPLRPASRAGPAWSGAAIGEPSNLPAVDPMSEDTSPQVSALLFYCQSVGSSLGARSSFHTSTQVLFRTPGKRCFMPNFARGWSKQVEISISGSQSHGMSLRTKNAFVAIAFVPTSL